VSPNVGKAPLKPNVLPYEPLEQFRPTALQDDSALADSHGKRIGILIVTYNAVTTLTRVLKRITPNVWRNVEQVLVLDDASQDATFELAMGIKTLVDLPQLQVLRHDKNLGYGGNQKAGYQYLIEQGFDAVVLLHGDGQYAPEILSHLYGPIVRGEADAVFGSRMMKTYGGPLQGGMPLYKFIGNRILTGFENRLLNMKLTEFHSGYRAYSLQALKEIDFSNMTDDFHFDTEIIIKLHHQKFRLKEVPIPTYYGNELCYVDGLKYARNVARAVRRYLQTRRSVTCWPEFREYFTHYPIKHSKYSSHYYARKLVGSNQDVLDLGCGEGFLSSELAKAGNRVSGVDALPEASERAAMAAYYQADLDEGIADVIDELNGKTFDRVLLLDILEHLRSPERILRECQQVLGSKGVMLVSLPNVANITVRLMLLAGKFNYVDRGILDKTHLHFYTRKTAKRLLEDNGYQVLEIKATVIPIELVLGVAPENPVMKLLTRIMGMMVRVMPGLFAYQYVFVIQKARRP
jgi:2-polyprenyl-3-methyl-5-hydroxy-6-metoxy-1,4-benzoquinol methylase